MLLIFYISKQLAKSFVNSFLILRTMLSKVSVKINFLCEEVLVGIIRMYFIRLGQNPILVQALDLDFLANIFVIPMLFTFFIPSNRILSAMEDRSTQAIHVIVELAIGYLPFRVPDDLTILIFLRH